MKNYYEILEISRTATANEIKKQYRKLANKFHPDKNNGDKAAEECFKDIVKAYEYLSDPLKRAAYDKKTFEEQNTQFANSPTSNAANYSPSFKWQDAVAAVVIFVIIITGIAYLSKVGSKS